MAEPYNLDYIRRQTQRMRQPQDPLGQSPPDPSAPAPPSPTPGPSTQTAATAPGPSAAPAPSQIAGNSPLEQQFWGLFGPDYRAGAQGVQLTPDMLRGQSGALGQMGIQIISDDKIRLPDGTIVDVIGDVGGANQSAWQIDDGRGGGGAGAGAGGAAGAGAGMGAGGAPGVDPALSQAVRDQLLRLLNQGNQPINVENDPRAAAYRRARERGADRERAQAAERAAFTGLNLGGQGSGAFDTQLQGIREGAGEDVASFEADLAGQEVQARRQQLMQALDLANAVGARQEALALQRQLGEMDNAYRYSALGQNQRQFDTRLGYDYDQLEALMNRQSVLDLLG